MTDHGKKIQDKDAAVKDAPEAPRGQTRRQFLGRVGGVAAAAASAELLAEPKLARAQHDAGHGAGSPAFAPLSKEKLLRRRKEAYRRRVGQAQGWYKARFEIPLNNGDERLYPNKIGNFTKGLPHNSLGEVDPAAYGLLVHACESGRPQDFDAIPLGGVRPLRNPQAGLAFAMEGLDPNQTVIPPAPPFASEQLAAEMAELYTMALLRDTPFIDYSTDGMALWACEQMSSMVDFRGPKSGGVVIPDTLFRAPYPGATDGPFVSQFLLRPYYFGSTPVEQVNRVFTSGVEYLTNYNDWLACQNGGPIPARSYDPQLRYLRTGRDLACWVDIDPPSQAGLTALLILLQMGAPLNAANPYVNRIVNQDSFTTLGMVDFFDMIEKAPALAHRAAWFQKWRIHRFLRPEEYGGRVHNHLSGAANYPIPADLLNSVAVNKVLMMFGSYLLPQVYPEGAPLHTSYPSGHSVGAGSTVTALKAIFDENFVIPNPVESSPDGLSLVPYDGPPLTVGGELNKLAWNVGCGRLFGGIHWRSDVEWGNRLGQTTTLAMMRDEKHCYNEPFSGYSLSLLDGEAYTIS